MIGIEEGWDGAQEAYDYLFPVYWEQPSNEDIPDLALRAGWALDFIPNAPPIHPTLTATASSMPSTTARRIQTPARKLRWRRAGRCV